MPVPKTRGLGRCRLTSPELIGGWTGLLARLHADIKVQLQSVVCCFHIDVKTVMIAQGVGKCSNLKLRFYGCGPPVPLSFLVPSDINSHEYIYVKIM